MSFHSPVSARCPQDTHNWTNLAESHPDRSCGDCPIWIGRLGALLVEVLQVGKLRGGFSPDSRFPFVGFSLDDELGRPDSVTLPPNRSNLDEPDPDPGLPCQPADVSQSSCTSPAAFPLFRSTENTPRRRALSGRLSVEHSQQAGAKRLERAGESCSADLVENLGHVDADRRDHRTLRIVDTPNSEPVPRAWTV